jgi:hypothetical protein
MAVVEESDLFLAQYEMDAENIRYAKEIQWRIPTVTIGLYSAVVAALSFWKQAGLSVSGFTVVLLLLALGVLGVLGLYMINGVRKNLCGYRRRQNAISSFAFPDNFKEHAISPDEYIRNKFTDIVFQGSFSLVIGAGWLALYLLLRAIAS